MAGRRTFFSFHYQRDVWRASIVRNTGVVDASAAAGFTDASLWEEAKKQGPEAIRRLINNGLNNTSVTVVLIGAETSTRRWVRYEIERSVERGNGLLGVYIHMLRDQNGNTDSRGEVPQVLVENRTPCHDWDSGRFASWVEKAAVKAGHPCLRHGMRQCTICM